MAYVIRDGFVFTKICGQENVCDAIVIRQPNNAPCSCPVLPTSERSFQEHIDFINKYSVEKALVIADNIEFITGCPSLKHFYIIPSDDAKEGFDYSPLYRVQQVKALDCVTQYGGRNKFKASVDYSKINGLESLGVSGPGHLNYNTVRTLKTVGISGNKESDLRNVLGSDALDCIMLIQCGMKSLEGLQIAKGLQCLYLYYNRSLSDISALKSVKKTIKALRIENCPKIEDFSVLSELENLELLDLRGSNTLPSLSFMKSLKNLKTFVFSVNVLDGDLSLCKNLSCVRSIKNRKHYNIKDRDLPKGHYFSGNDGVEIWRRYF